MIKIYPSLISANLLHLGNELAKFDPYVDGYHIDIMDGHFVPNITWGPAFINTFVEATTRPLHVHFMTSDPERWFSVTNLRPSDYVIFHIESYQENFIDAQLLITNIKEQSIRVGIALNPETPVATIEPLLDRVDDVLIMAVHPGFSGQHFISSVKPKIRHLNKLREQRGLTYTLSIDGGVKTEHVHELYLLGIENFCVASALFDSLDPVATISAFRQEITASPQV